MPKFIVYLISISFWVFLLFNPSKTKADFEHNLRFNIAPNSSFEDGFVQPANWIPIDGKFCIHQDEVPNAQVVWSSDNAFSGSKSINLANIQWSGPPSAIPGSWKSSEIDIQTPQVDHYAIAKIKIGNTSSNLTAVLWYCALDSNGNILRYAQSYPGSLPTDGSWNNKFLQILPNTKLSKIIVGISASCINRGSCSGDVWADDVIIVPQSGKPTFHAYEDLNRNQFQDQFENNLSGWAIKFFDGFECDPDKIGIEGATTDESGNTDPINSTFSGEYSASVNMKVGWNLTVPLCQNVILHPGVDTYINYGLVQNPTFPYFSQKDPAWGQDEYDHGNTLGPFFCGTTMAGCGCAVTSSAMILKFHGVDKAPNGQPTNPQTLNNWLKDNNGYAFGAIKWNSVASFALKANQQFGTQKLKFSGVGSANNFTLLESDLSAQNPPVLQQPGHFIVATGNQGGSYSIHDPAFENKTNLSSYGNEFNSSRRFEKTNTDLSALYLSTPSQNDLFLTDSQSRRLGKDPQTGIIYNEIPNSYYFLEPAVVDQSQEDTDQPPAGAGVKMLVILNPQTEIFDVQAFGEDDIKIDFSAYDRDGEIKSREFSSPSSENFEITYSPEPGSDFTVYQNVDFEILGNTSEKSGIVPVIINSSENFDVADIDISSLLFGEAGTAKDKANFVSTGQDNQKDLKVFFDSKEINWASELCILGKTILGSWFKSCSP